MSVYTSCIIPIRKLVVDSMFVCGRAHVSEIESTVLGVLRQPQPSELGVLLKPFENMGC